MPLNPNKKRCAVSGCNAWAMRGHTHCRAHRDAEPGSRRQRGAGARGAGAPPNNLNALRHGRYSHPLPDLDLQRLAAGIVEQPDDLPYRVGLAVQSIHARAGDPALTLVATSRLLSQLASQVAAALFDRRLQAYLCDLPAPLRERVRSTFERLAAVHSPVERLLLLKKIKKREKTMTGNGNRYRRDWELLPAGLGKHPLCCGVLDHRGFA